MFESSVILEGSKTSDKCCDIMKKFESSVILEGSKTIENRSDLVNSLRVVLF